MFWWHWNLIDTDLLLYTQTKKKKNNNLIIADWRKSAENTIMKIFIVVEHCIPGQHYNYFFIWSSSFIRLICRCPHRSTSADRCLNGAVYVRLSKWVELPLIDVLEIGDLSVAQGSKFIRLFVDSVYNAPLQEEHMAAYVCLGANLLSHLSTQVVSFRSGPWRCDLWHKLGLMNHLEPISVTIHPWLNL